MQLVAYVVQAYDIIEMLKEEHRERIEGNAIQREKLEEDNLKNDEGFEKSGDTYG